jgi:hypothetical protein
LKRESNLNLSGNDLYYTASSLLVISKNSNSELHCRKDLNLILFDLRTVDARYPHTSSSERERGEREKTGYEQVSEGVEEHMLLRRVQPAAMRRRGEDPWTPPEPIPPEPISPWTPAAHTTPGPSWGHPNVVLGAILSLCEPFCGHLSPKMDKVS